MPYVKIGLCFLLASCVMLGASTSSASTVRVGSEAQSPVTMPVHAISALTVLVPPDLRVSEADSFYPLADIVWHGDPPGDRHAQVEQIFREATVAAVADQPLGQAAILEIKVIRFHCLTRKSRYTFGGVHSIHFELTLLDPATNAILFGPERVLANLKAPSGAGALTEEFEKGRSQRQVIVAWLSHVIRRQIALPGVVTAAR